MSADGISSDDLDFNFSLETHQGSSSPIENYSIDANGNSKTLRQELQELKAEVAELKNKLTSNEKNKTQVEKPVIPKEIKCAVRNGYTAGKNEKKEWNLTLGSRFQSLENLEMTTFIRSYILGLYPTTPFSVTDAAINRYYLTLKERQSRIRNNKYADHVHRQGILKRKRLKAKRRMDIVKERKGWTEEKQEMVNAMLKCTNLMSSEEEDDNKMIVTRYAWHSKKWRKMKTNLDQSANSKASAKSLRMRLPRVDGEIKIDTLPPPEAKLHPWIIARKYKETSADEACASSNVNTLPPSSSH